MNERTFKGLKIHPFATGIEVSEYYTARNTIGCDYYFATFLVNEDYELVDSFSFNDTIQEFPSKWKCVKHTFQIAKLKKPVRYVIMYHAGKVFDLELICIKFSFVCLAIV